MKTAFKFSEEQAKFIEAYTEVTDDSEIWYYIPFCFKKVDKNTYEMCGVKQTPQHVREAVEKANNVLIEETHPFEIKVACEHKNISYVEGNLTEQDQDGEEWTIECTGYAKCNDCGRILQINLWD